MATEDEHLPSDENLRTIPQGKGMLIHTTGKCEIVDGPFDLKRLYSLLKCEMVQWLPCTVGRFAVWNLELWMNESGMNDGTELNQVATNKLGSQGYGGKLYGNILVKQTEEEPEEEPEEESVMSC